MLQFFISVLLTFSLFMTSASASEFLWGVANSAFQTEGSPADSDWRRFSHEKGRIRDGSNADQSSDFWNRYEEDFDLAKAIGLNAFRISVAWERIEPKKGEWDLAAVDRYRQMAKAMRARGLEPIFTLHHFVLPQWLAEEGGLLAPGFEDLFVRYAKQMILALSPGKEGVKIWLTMNEPEYQVLNGYYYGKWAPGVQGSKKVARAIANLARAHIKTVITLRPLVDNEVRFSIAAHWSPTHARTKSPVDLVIARFLDRIGNHAFYDALVTGKIVFWMPGGGRVRERIKLPGKRPTVDFIGINYYTRAIVSFTLKKPHVKLTPGPGPKNEMGWEMYPQGMEQSIQEAYRRYKLPIFVTENGTADRLDQWRGQFIQDHVQSMMKAKAQGIPVIGYLHWSLTDNFEWIEGLTPRFGLVEIDYHAGSKRIPRSSYFTYGAMIRSIDTSAIPPVNSSRE